MGLCFLLLSTPVHDHQVSSSLNLDLALLEESRLHPLLSWCRVSCLEAPPSCVFLNLSFLFQFGYKIQLVSYIKMSGLSTFGCRAAPRRSCQDSAAKTLAWL